MSLFLLGPVDVQPLPMSPGLIFYHKYRYGMDKRIKKPWGWTTLVFKTDTVEVWLAKIDAGGYCSVHCHEHKENLFHVVSGMIDVVIYDPWKTEIRRHRIGGGDQLTVDRTVFHKFEAPEAATILEVYYTKLAISEDIVRIITGGNKLTQDQNEPRTTVLPGQDQTPKS
jgi:mannose-6-phosphate isomerase-like protein (cupin superfamily)